VYALLEFWQKNHGNTYYEPTIVVHETSYVNSEIRTTINNVQFITVN